MRLRQLFARAVARPYIFNELPGWGYLYRLLVGGDAAWCDAPTIWSRGKLHGYEMLLDLRKWSSRATYFLGRLYDLPTQRLLMQHLKPGDTLIDVGANEGHISLLASRLVGPSGSVIAFEPNPQPRSFLERMIERNRLTNISVMPMGLADRDAVLTLNVPKVSSGEATFGRTTYREGEFEAVESQVRRGDDVLAGVTPTVIKIDVEGFELYVLRGLRDTIQRARPVIVMEMIGSHLAAANTKASEIDGFMRELGYKPFSLAFSRSAARHKLNYGPIEITDQIDADVVWMP